MQSAQESLAELRAAIRYCENAISAAEGTIESMDFRQQLAKQQAMNKKESTGREVALTNTVKELEEANEKLVVDNYNLEREVAHLKECLKIETAALERLREDTPTMPVIPRDVAIAIFREGIKQGVSDACDALSEETIQIDETEYCGDFEVSFSREIDLGDDLDLDWIRDKVGSYDAESVTNNLRGLLENLNFGCRIHGIDDNE